MNENTVCDFSKQFLSSNNTLLGSRFSLQYTVYKQQLGRSQRKRQAYINIKT